MHVLALPVAQTTAVQSASPYLGAIVMLAMGVLLVVIGFLLAYVLFERRLDRLPRELQEKRALAQAQAAAAGIAAGGGSTAEAPPRSSRPPGMVCPACRREYDVGVRYCPHDAKALVAIEASPARAVAGGICPSCKRAFDPGVKYCPHDAEELIPMAFWEATRGRARASGVIGKICPACAAKYDIEETFCGKD